MKGGLRQSMAWLHTWAGLLLGWILFFMFLTGTVGYFDTEIDRWMRPELPLRSAELSTTQAAAVALERIHTEAPNAEQWIIYPPTGHDISEINVFWRTAAGPEGGASSASEVLDRATGQPIEARDTGGGQTLYQMHYLFHYLPSSVAYWIAGVSTMFMLVAILSGVITHKKIFRDFFTFRPHKHKRAWLDAHNVLGVLALPFHLMITYSGLIFFAFTYMPLIIAGTYGAGADNRQQFFNEAFSRGTAVVRSDVAAPLAPLGVMIAAAESRWGPGQVRSIDARYPGDANARVFITRSHVTPASNGERLIFDGVSGAMLESPGRSGAMLVNETMMSLHEGLFSGPILRWLYFLSGLLGTAMIATGLIYWTAKRRAESNEIAKRRTESEGSRSFGLALVERLNVGTITGLPIAIAVYFWANRLIPADVPTRSEWEVHAMFIAWAIMLAHPLFRPPGRAWIEQLCIAAALFGTLPLLNVLTTDRHLGATLLQGEWAWAGVDLTLLGFGIAFGWGARRLQQRRVKVAMSAGSPTLPAEIRTEPA